ncbi:MAG: hypothetical protein HUJ26_18745 [Planctomycetaceae bacterium]|nr:hypothetical protein [Planctomycetaceae bacterium]
MSDESFLITYPSFAMLKNEANLPAFTLDIDEGRAVPIFTDQDNLEVFAENFREKVEIPDSGRIIMFEKWMGFKKFLVNLPDEITFVAFDPDSRKVLNTRFVQISQLIEENDE